MDDFAGGRCRPDRPNWSYGFYGFHGADRPDWSHGLNGNDWLDRPNGSDRPDWFDGFDGPHRPDRLDGIDGPDWSDRIDRHNGPDRTYWPDHLSRRGHCGFDRIGLGNVADGSFRHDCRHDRHTDAYE